MDDENAVEIQLTAYLMICAGVGCMFGSFGGFLFREFFVPQMFFGGLLIFGIGFSIFAPFIRVRKGT